MRCYACGLHRTAVRITCTLSLVLAIGDYLFLVPREYWTDSFPFSNKCASTISLWWLVMWPCLSVCICS